MQLKIDALHTNNARTVVPLPYAKHAIGCKWVFKVKYKSDSSVERNKTRIVAKLIINSLVLTMLRLLAPLLK